MQTAYSFISMAREDKSWPSVLVYVELGAGHLISGGGGLGLILKNSLSLRFAKKLDLFGCIINVYLF